MSARFPCGDPRCLVCRSHRLYTPDSERRTAEIMRRTLSGMDGWRKREAERLRRLYPQPSPLQRLIEEVEARRAAR